ncbi:F-box/LRR-repeat protein 14-like isoform X4 [Wolffia australiana]
MDELPSSILAEILLKIDNTKDMNSAALVCKRFHSVDGDQRGSLRVGCGLHPAIEALNLLCMRFPHLKSIEIAYPGWTPSHGNQLDDQGLLLLPTLSPSLETLTLNFCSFITDSGLSHLSSFKHLRSLQLNFAPSISSNGLLTLVVGCKNLSKLHLSRCMKLRSSEWLDYLGKFGVLEDLTVKNCKAIFEHDIMKLGSGLRRLRRLDLEIDSNYRDRNNRHGRNSVNSPSSCEAMEEIRLKNCELLDGEGLSLLLPSCGSLKKLAINKCFGLMDSHLIAMALKSVSLKELELVCCHDFSDEGLRLVNALPCLETLTLRECSGITDNGLLSLIGPGPKKLLNLTVEDCPQISLQAIAAVRS